MQQTVYIIISSLAGGGAERVCVNLCNELAERGFRVELTVVNLNDDAFSKELSEGIILTNFNQKHIRNSIINLYKYLKNRKNCTLLVFNYEVAFILLMLRKLFRWPAIIVTRSISTLSQNIGSHKGIKKYLVKWAMRKMAESDKIICQSRGMQQDLLNYLHVPAEKTIVINNPLNKNIEQFVKLNKQLIIQYKKKDYLLYIGRFSEEKGLFELLDAFKRVCTQNQVIQLKLVGKGTLEKELRAYVKELKLSERVEFIPFTQEIIPLYLGAKVTVLSSRYEGFPNVLIESTALGTPVIAFDCPSGPRDIIIENKNGHLAAERKSELLAEKIIEALEKEWDKQYIIQTAIRYYSENIISEYINCICNKA